MKTKAFSKEGLIAAARLDPNEKAKVEMSQWLTSQVDELSRRGHEGNFLQIYHGVLGRIEPPDDAADADAILESLNQRKIIGQE